MTNHLPKVVLISACLLAPTSTSLADFEFAVSADQRQYAGSGQYDTSSYFRGAMEALDLLDPGVFMVSPGDIDPVADQRWTIDAVLGAAYTWYPVVGNHELPGDGSESYTGENMDYLRAYNYGSVNGGPTGCPETTFSFDYDNVHFVVINEYCDLAGDTATNGDIPDHLYNWLVTDIQGTTKDHIFVFGHEPAYPLPDMDNNRLRHETDSLNQNAANRDRFWNLLRDEGVLAYMHGHTHNTSAEKIDGVWQVDVGHARGAGDTGAASTFTKVRVSGTVATLDIYRDEHDGSYDYLDIHHNRLLTGSCATMDLDATQDTYIDAGAVGSNYGASTPLLVDGSPDLAALVKWDVTSIPDGAFISTASIHLNVTNESDDVYHVYQLLRDWDEGTGNGTATGDGATWNTYDGTNLWESAGAQGVNDRGTTTLGTTPGSASTGLESFSLNDAGARLISDWMATPAINYGLIIQDYDETNSYRFNSAEGSTPPTLTVEYCGDDGEIIGDTVYEDIDGNGIQDSSEPGIADIIINLFNDNNSNGVLDGPDTLNQSRTTDGDGHYLFIGKPAGDYIIDIDSIPASYTLTTACEPCSLTAYTPGTIANNIDFGYQQVGTGSIGGLIWDDINSDNSPSGESGISGVTVDLYRDVNNDSALDAGDLYLTTRTTNASGYYDFTGLTDAGYIVDVTDTGNLLTAKFITGATDPVAVSLTGGATIDSIDFGYVDVSCSTVNLDAVEDTYIQRGNATTNYGGSTRLRVDGSPDADERSALIKWEVSSIPDGAFISTASIRLNITNRSANSYQVYQLLRNWNEDQATWNQYASGSGWQTVGAQGTSDRGDTSLGATPGSSSTGLETFSLNASGLQLISDWVNNVFINNYGLIIQDYSQTDSYQFHSSEDSSPPRLTVEHCSSIYGTGTGSIGGLIWNDLNADRDPSSESGISGVTVDLFRDINSDGTLDAGDVLLNTQTTDGSGIYDFTGLPDGEYIVDVTDTGNVLLGMAATGASGPVAVSLTGGADISNENIGFAEAACYEVNLDTDEDTYIEAGTPSSNYGSSATLLVDGAPAAEDRATLIKWNISPIPDEAFVNSASITLNVTNESSNNYPVYQLLRDWNESQTTWNQYASGSDWQTAGAMGANDRGNTFLGETPGSGGATGLQTFSLNVSALQLINDWVNDISINNYGLIIQDYGQSNGYDFTSSEGGTAPRLTVNYCELGPTAATIGKVGLEAIAIVDLLLESGTEQTDTGALLALLKEWNPGLAAILVDADRAELLEALSEYLDPDGDSFVVALRWETLEERGTIGFYAERQTTDLGWQQLHNDMLPGLIVAPMGGEYLLFDPEVNQPGEYLYRLIEVEAWGTKVQHGPWLLRLK